MVEFWRNKWLKLAIFKGMKKTCCISIKLLVKKKQQKTEGGVPVVAQ